MYYRDDCSLTDSIVGTLFMSGLFYLTHLGGKQAAYKEIEEKQQKDEISELRKKLNELNEYNKRNRSTS